MKTTLNICCALAVAALAACGGGGGTSGTGTSSTGGTSGTTGSGCISLGGSCAGNQTCCVTATQDLTCSANNRCVPASGSATTSGGASTTGGSTGTDPCPLSAVGGACATSIDCQSGLLCVAGSSSSTCQQPVAGQTNCAALGQGPSAAGGPCCESAVDAGGTLTCSTWVACIETGNPCSATSPCCNGLTCDGSSHTCIAACGSQATVCTTDSDCCADQGLHCTPGSVFTPPVSGSVCEAFPLNSQSDGTGYFYCNPNPLCEAFDGGTGIVECQLGAACDYGVFADGGADPCAALGLVCDATTQVCRAPIALEDLCIQGGPACQQIADSTAVVDCIPDQTISLCAEPCKNTPDCVDGRMTCQGQTFCSYNGCTSTQYFGTCSASATNDGICAPLGAEANPELTGLCFQAATNDGGAGQSCNINANRQLGGFCDNKDVCITGICGAVCNSGKGTPGSAPTPACPQGQACVSAIGFWEINDSQDFGGCVDACSLTDGGCGVTSANVATKCLPSELLDYGPATGTPVVDFCAPLAADPIAIGQPCGDAPVSDAIDPCVAGAMCYGTFGTTNVCVQICTDGEIGLADALGGCPSGDVCTGVSFTGDQCGTGTACPAGETCSSGVCNSSHLGVCLAGASNTTGATTGTGTGTTGSTTGSSTDGPSSVTGATGSGSSGTTGSSTTGGSGTTSGATTSGSATTVGATTSGAATTGGDSGTTSGSSTTSGG